MDNRPGVRDGLRRTPAAGATLLSDFRRDEKVQQLIERGVRELDRPHVPNLPLSPATF
jgi:hypothetical protein